MERFFDGLPLGRRTFLKGAGAAGALASLSSFAHLVTEAGASGVAVPEGARNVEAGLGAFAAKWEAAGPAILLTRFGRFLSNKIFNCHVAGTPRAYALTLGGAGATLTPGRNPFAHANLVLDEGDWNAVLYGDVSGLAPILAGRCFPSRDEANRAVLLAIVMYVFAHIPASADNDPAFLVEVMRDLLDQRGLPECDGEPSAIEPLDDLRADPEAEVGEILLGASRAAPVTERLATWVYNLAYDDIAAQPDLVATAKEQLASILGVAYAGLTMEPGRRLVAAVGGFGDAPQATVIGGSARFPTSARNAAMANSFLAQILEWEDWTFLTHSGAAIVPVVLAAAELARFKGRPASGRDVLAAIVAGNEILARAGEFLTDVVHTGNAQVVHQLELPLLAGKLLGLTVEQLRDAVGIACTQPQVTSIPSWVGGAKGMLTAAPAQTAILAAELADAGLSGRRDLLENPLGYFYRVADIVSPRRLDRALAGLNVESPGDGTDWRFASRYFDKRYPTDGFQLPAVHATIQVHGQIVGDVERLVDASEIERVRARIPLVMAASATMFGAETGTTAPEGRAALERVRQGNGWTYIALLFDGYYPLAAALRYGRLTHREYQPAALADAEIDALIAKIELVPDLSRGVFGAEVTVTMTDDSTHEAAIDCIRKDTDDSFVNDGHSAAEKFHEAAKDVLSDEQRSGILAAISTLETIDDIRDFTALL